MGEVAGQTGSLLWLATNISEFETQPYHIRLGLSCFLIICLDFGMHLLLFFGFLCHFPVSQITNIGLILASFIRSSHHGCPFCYRKIIIILVFDKYV